MSQLQQSAAGETTHHHSNQNPLNTNGNNNLSNLSCSNVNGNSSSSSLASLVPGGVVTTQNISTVIKPKENNNSMQFVKITPPDLSKKAVEQIRVAQESKITKDKLKEVEEEWQSNLLKWKSKRRQHFVGPSGNKDDDEEQNNNNIENGSGRKVKTFAEMIEQRARAGNRLNFNLQRYIGSADEEETPEHDKRDGDDHLQQDDLQEGNDRSDVVDFINGINCHDETLVVRDNHKNLHKSTEKIESNNAPTPQSQTNQIPGEPRPPQRLARTLQANSETAHRQPELKPLPRAPSSPKPHLEMLKQKFESLNQQHQTPPLQRPVLSFQRQQHQPPLAPFDQSQGQQFTQPAQSKQAQQNKELPPSKSLPRSSSNEAQLQQISPPKQQQQQQNVRLSELPVPRQAQLPPPPPSQQHSPHLRPQQLSPPQQRLADISLRKSSITDTQQLGGSTQQYSRSELKHRHESTPPIQHQKYQAPMPPQPCPTRIPTEVPSSQSHGTTQQRTKLPPPSPPRSHRMPQLTPTLPSPASNTSTESAPQPPPTTHPQQHIRNNNHNHKNKHLDHQPPQNDPDKDPVLSVSGKRRCSSCKEELGRGAAAFVVESLNLVYHTNCFKCSVCHVDLSNGFRGVDVRVHAGALHCQNCYSKDGLNYSRV